LNKARLKQTKKKSSLGLAVRQEDGWHFAEQSSRRKCARGKSSGLIPLTAGEREVTTPICSVVCCRGNSCKRTQHTGWSPAMAAARLCIPGGEYRQGEGLQGARVTAQRRRDGGTLGEMGGRRRRILAAILREGL
jgi:hypothetical protein